MKRMLKTAAAVLLGASMLVTGALAANTSFSDVPSNHWAYSYVTRAAQEGLVNGMGDGVYGENVPLKLLLLLVSVRRGRLSQGRPGRHRGRRAPPHRRGLDRHGGGGGHEPL